MTREEAINELRYAQAMFEFNPTTGEVGFRNEEDKRQYKAFDMAIKALQEQKTGKWIFKNDLKQFFCDKCAEPSLTYDDIYIYGMELSKFCPNCGAKMVGEEE